jgi:DNA gyrase/topoisomerase IV subunit B
LQSKAKKRGFSITRHDVKDYVNVFGILKLKQPKYDSQNKSRLTGPSLKSEIEKLLETGWNSFLRKQKDQIELLLDKAEEKYKRLSSKKTAKELKTKRPAAIPNLIDASSRTRNICSLFITEGLSASSMLTEVRDPSIHGIFSLTGKINNVYGVDPAVVIKKMGKLKHLLSALGLVPGIEDISGLRYGRIYISTDADPDGDDIMSLLINMFYSFWPKLFDPKDPKIYRLNAPNVIARKGDKFKYFTTRKQYEQEKEKYKNWTIDYCKGLGSMVIEDWRELITNLDKYSYVFVDDGNYDNVLKLLFDNSLSNERKLWLQKDLNNG